jgi:phospholipid-binding lipoprotein MlaA
MKHAMRSLIVVLVLAALTGCATTDSHDPFEGYNRAMFAFNDKVDQAVLKPTAIAYREAAPEPVQIAIANFFENLSDVWTGANNLLQGKVEDGLNDFMRFSVNSTLGIAGLIDIGSAAGIPKHKQDFGTTLGVWGVPSGPYVVLPLMGPSTVRDTAALPVDFQGDPWSYVDPARARYAGSALRLVDKRAAVLDAFNLIDEAALDRYEFIRDAFLQRRENKIDQSKERGSDGFLPADQSSLTPSENPVNLSYTNPEVAAERREADVVIQENRLSNQADRIVASEADGAEKTPGFNSAIKRNAEKSTSLSSEAIVH